MYNSNNALSTLFPTKKGLYAKSDLCPYSSPCAVHELQGKSLADGDRVREVAHSAQGSWWGPELFGWCSFPQTAIERNRQGEWKNQIYQQHCRPPSSTSVTANGEWEEAILQPPSVTDSTPDSTHYSLALRLSFSLSLSLPISLALFRMPWYCRPLTLT